MTLPYDICVALKAKGFPYSDQKYPMWVKEANSEPVISPTLEDLVSGCPESLEKPDEYWFTLQKETKHWTAGYLWYDTWHDKRGVGSTPSEAVANLYLSINPVAQKV